jgi:hypothetical protein|tara:strand:- start:261 stop:710 length:450 start_codon:yes stop_codon:yes gene_type:complete
MATVIKLKTGTSTPSTSDIASREVAIDTSAQKFYINDSGTIKEIGGAGTGTLTSLTDVTLSNSVTSQYLIYNGTAWVNEHQHNVVKTVPFIKTDASVTAISMVNNKDMTTINGFLDHVVLQSYYLPFTNASGTAVTTVRPGHMPELSEI